MAATVYTLESANLICGDARSPAAGGEGTARTSPGISTHLVLQELKLPAWEENYQDLAPGGAPVAIEIPMHMNKLEATFNLAGWDPSIMIYVGQNSPACQRFTAYGLIRDRRTSLAHQAVAVIEGRMGRVNPAAFSKGNLMHHEYSIKSIVHYELWMQTESGDARPNEIYWWDFFTSQMRFGRVVITDDMVRLLAIPGNPT
jgi:phage tail tube protein FII